MAQRIKTVQESDLRMLGDLARSIQRVLPVTQADIDAAAALGKGWVVWKVFEVSDPLDNLRGGTQLIIRQNSIQPGQNVRRVIFVAGPGGQTVVIRGTDYIVLPDAIANSLSYVKAFGGTEQNGAPTPDSPMDIITNNGALKASRNLFNDETVILDQGTITVADAAEESSPNRIRSRNYIPVMPNTTYTLSGVISGSGLQFSYREFTSASQAGFTYSSNWQTAPFTTRSDTKYIRFVISKTNNTNLTPADVTNLQLEFGSTATPYMPYGQVYTDGTVETINVHGTNLLDLANCTDGYYYTPAGEYTATPNARLSNYIPVKAGVTYTVGLIGTEGQSNVRINLFDTAKNWLSQTVFISYAGEEHVQTITPTQDGFLAFSANYLSSSRVDWNTAQVVQGSYTVATMPEYAPYYDGGTATAEMLLKVGDYQDVQSILDGVVTRNIGVKVLDGTENWAAATTSQGVYRYRFEPTDAPKLDGGRGHCMSTHFFDIGGVSTQDIGGVFASTVFLYFIPNQDVDTVTKWTTYLANQYAAGTPVIVIYPLATPTTESVAGQALQVTGGDNVLEITQASLTGLELEAQYSAVVTLTVQEVEDANLDNNVTVTIS